MAVTFQRATKQQAKARVAVTGPAGAGKTYTALRIATSMCNKVAVIDTEHGSASKYADEFTFDVLELADFHPNNYVEAINAAQQAGYDGVVIDSASHEWFGKNGCLELVDVYAKRKNGNSYAAWADVTPLHTGFIEAIHQSRIHVFATFRSKMDYVQSEDAKGKKSYQKVGMAPVTREGAEYEFDVVLDMDLEHVGIVSKSRCKALADKIFRLPGEELAKQLLAWLDSGAPAPEPPPQPPSQPETPPAQPPAASNGSANGHTSAVSDAEYEELKQAARAVGITTKEAWLEIWRATLGSLGRSAMTRKHLQAMYDALDAHHVRRAAAEAAATVGSSNGSANEQATLPVGGPDPVPGTPEDDQRIRTRFFTAANDIGLEADTARAWIRMKWAIQNGLESPPASTEEVPADYIASLTQLLKNGQVKAADIASFVKEQAEIPF